MGGSGGYLRYFVSSGYPYFPDFIKSYPRVKLV